MRFLLDSIRAKSATGATPIHDHSQHRGAMPPPSPSSGKPAADKAASLAPAGYDAYLRDMHVGMEKMMQDMHADPPSGDPDIDFLVMMVPHHWGAVEMARLVLRDGRDPLVREIAEAILAGQQTEMQGMRGRLEALRRGGDGYPSLSGNRGP
ncbi:conserved hypothetical protein [Bosea sp. 62]|uniref:DUF305 domain-containing protein n=1 Tax=unclassified Bosea (in: a-proteobacteria) TaxID=2653178 RepID=UPI0012534C93|nr:MULTISPECIES: DUF305 domain-containing protein [unclassified Bosea (in: a-proteobacteria)]CAD5254001.1 conserved hypothetical protein [Bosea sp. 21B]CAD5286743.1 conserved hypothetical protein [Bosea sp. 7B]CAD5301269.1 conserved hypothetical protein [Bosea sp. 46]VVT57368.1 conserved hypothetical protein [Bosea sp. EC-HK365B]VXB67131.1 conserved hypothetical protein [Bosea sp. 125]